MLEVLVRQLELSLLTEGREPLSLACQTVLPVRHEVSCAPETKVFKSELAFEELDASLTYASAKSVSLQPVRHVAEHEAPALPTSHSAFVHIIKRAPTRTRTKDHGTAAEYWGRLHGGLSRK